MKNLYTAPPEGIAGEFIEILASSGDVRVERIISHGDASPEGFWYDQDEHEFVAVLQGAARLRLQAPDEVIAMGPGDCLTIAAHRRHRVDWTVEDRPTVWLAVHFKAETA